MIGSAMTTHDTMIATFGKESFAASLTGLGADDPSDGVEEARVGAGELRLGATETNTKDMYVRSVRWENGIISHLFSYDRRVVNNRSSFRLNFDTNGRTLSQEQRSPLLVERGVEIGL